MWPNPVETVDLVTCTKEVHDEKLLFLCKVIFAPESISCSELTTETPQQCLKFAQS